MRRNYHPQPRPTKMFNATDGYPKRLKANLGKMGFEELLKVAGRQPVSPRLTPVRWERVYAEN